MLIFKIIILKLVVLAKSTILCPYPSYSNYESSFFPDIQWRHPPTLTSLYQSYLLQSSLHFSFHLPSCIHPYNMPNPRYSLCSYTSNYICMFHFVCFWSDSPQWARATAFMRFLDQTQWLLWTSEQLVAETSTWQHTHKTLTTDIHALGGIRTRSLGRRVAADLRLIRRGHWDRLHVWLTNLFPH